MAPIERGLLDAERERMRRLKAAQTSDPPAVGELWTVRPAVSAPGSGLIVEHSLAPLLVVVLRRSNEWLDVAPVSYDVDYAAPGDVIEREALPFDKPYMIETWLRLRVAEMALVRRVGVVPKRTLSQARRDATRLVSSPQPALPAEDPRRAYRQDERLRVLFAGAASGDLLDVEELTTEQEIALALKRGEPVRWKTAPAPDGLDPMPGYPERARVGKKPSPAGVG